MKYPPCPRCLQPVCPPPGGCQGGPGCDARAEAWATSERDAKARHDALDALWAAEDARLVVPEERCAQGVLFG